MPTSTLEDLLDPLTVEGELYETLPDGALRCYACGHRCLIRPGKRGICQVRYNQEGHLRVPWGYVGALQCDPTEKKPFFHLYPGSDTLTFGMLGCDFHCSYCQNWVTSQAMRDPASDISAAGLRKVTARELVEYGLRMGARAVGSSYNEPLITSEWAVEVFKVALQLLARIMVILRVPGEPAGCAQNEQVQKVLIAECLVAHDVDLRDLGNLALVDREIDRDAVAFQRRYRGGDRDAVLALGKILALDFLLGLVELRAVENPAFLEIQRPLHHPV